MKTTDAENIDSQKSQTWSLEIKPSRGVLDIPFREIWEYRDL